MTLCPYREIDINFRRDHKVIISKKREDMMKVYSHLYDTLKIHQKNNLQE